MVVVVSRLWRLGKRIEQSWSALLGMFSQGCLLMSCLRLSNLWLLQNPFLFKPFHFLLSFLVCLSPFCKYCFSLTSLCNLQHKELFTIICMLMIAKYFSMHLSSEKGKYSYINKIQILHTNCFKFLFLCSIYWEQAVCRLCCWACYIWWFCTIFSEWDAHSCTMKKAVGLRYGRGGANP